eukprot:TRINITY_DN51802_c0_g1_i1.p1 TRINITY_DN51802_c0_g1~~TRINITY_DN51802_c0_g1_i1.p1  ORF type:complete len:265 (+),score=24.42 TRINITY_DN51802_c0_g1_i1:52-795(+)
MALATQSALSRLGHKPLAIDSACRHHVAFDRASQRVSFLSATCGGKALPSLLQPCPATPHARRVSVVAAAKGSKRGGKGADRVRRTDAPPESTTATTEISVESADESSVRVRVHVTGQQTQQLMDKTLRSLAKDCPPVPGAKLGKGGKITAMDKAVLLRLIGKARVHGFVINELVNGALLSYLDKEGLAADGDAKTIESAEDLQAKFAPGQPFDFTAEIPVKPKEEQVEEATAVADTTPVPVDVPST